MIDKDYPDICLRELVKYALQLVEEQDSLIKQCIEMQATLRKQQEKMEEMLKEFEEFFRIEERMANDGK